MVELGVERGGEEGVGGVGEGVVTEVEDMKSLRRRISALERVVESLREERESLKDEVRALRSTTPKSDVAPSKSSDKGWRVAGGKRACLPRSQPPKDQVECRNSFHALSELKEDEKEVEEVRKVVADSLPRGNILIVGDSQVRYLDRAFCARDRKRRTRVCFPGAGVGHVSERIEACMANEGIKPIVCLSAGGNDVGKVRSEELLRRFKEVLGKVRDRGGIPLVCGILPRRKVGCEWLCRAIAMNCRLAEHCKANGWTFVDNWDRFFGNDHLYQRDGVHLSHRGFQLLADVLEREVASMFF